MKGNLRPRPRKQFLVLADDLTEEGGIRTRILGELSVINKPGQFVVLSRVRAKNLKQAAKAKEFLSSAYPSVDLRFVPVLPHRGKTVLMEAAVLFNILILCFATMVLYASFRFKRIYAHNFECGWAALLSAKMLRIHSMTLDMHGDFVEECMFQSGWKRGGMRHRLWTVISRMLVQKANRVVCVSEAHKEFLSSTYGRSTSVEVLPCCTYSVEAEEDSLRERLRAELGLNDPKSVVLFYSGSASKYQLIDRMIAFVSSLRAAEAECGFLLLLPTSEDVMKVQEMIQRLAPSLKTKFLSVPHREVFSYASAADIAFLFRNEAPMNRISSPTKFAEYLISGLPVLITPGIGDFSTAVAKYCLGAVVDLERVSDPQYAADTVASVLRDVTIRRRCRDFALKRLTWSAYNELIARAYFG